MRCFAYFFVYCVVSSATSVHPSRTAETVNIGDRCEAGQSSTKPRTTGNANSQTGGVERPGPAGSLGAGEPHRAASGRVFGSVNAPKAAGDADGVWNRETSKPQADGVGNRETSKPQADGVWNRETSKPQADSAESRDSCDQPIAATTEPRSDGALTPEPMYTAPDISAEEFDICINGYQSSIPPSTGPSAAAPEKPEIPLFQKNVVPATAAAENPVENPVEIPAAMDEPVMLLCFHECCPGKQYPTAAEMPPRVTFILLYVDEDDRQFFWAAVLYNDRTVSCSSCFSVAEADYLTSPYLMGKACYRLVLRPPAGPMRIPELTFRLLEPLGVISKLQE